MKIIYICLYIYVNDKKYIKKYTYLYSTNTWYIVENSPKTLYSVHSINLR